MEIPLGETKLSQADYLAFNLHSKLISTHYAKAQPSWNGGNFCQQCTVSSQEPFLSINTKHKSLITQISRTIETIEQVSEACSRPLCQIYIEI